jgi:hypothetical protein
MMGAGDCQCSRETMARKIISMEAVVRQARLDREHFCAASERVREPLAARVRWLERKLVEVAEAIESEPPTVVADTIWHDSTETLCDALRRWATNGDLRPNDKDQPAGASPARAASPC